MLEDCNWCNHYIKVKPDSMWSTVATFYGTPAGMSCGRPGRSAEVRECVRRFIGAHSGECYWIEHDPLGGDADVITSVAKSGMTHLVGVIDTACRGCEPCPEDEYTPAQPDKTKEMDEYVDTNEFIDKMLTGEDCQLCKLFQGKPGFTWAGGGVGLDLGYVYKGDCKEEESDLALIEVGPDYECAWIEKYKQLKVAYGFSKSTLTVDVLGVGGPLNSCGLCGCDRVVDEWKQRMTAQHAFIYKIDTPVVGFSHPKFKHWDQDAEPESESEQQGRWIEYFSEFADPESGRDEDDGLGCWKLQVCIELARVPNVYPDPDPEDPGFDPEAHKWDDGWWYSGITCACEEISYKAGNVEPQVWKTLVPGVVDFITFLPSTCDCPDLRDIIEKNGSVFGVTSNSPGGRGDNYVHTEVNIDGETQLLEYASLPGGESVPTTIPMLTEIISGASPIDFRTRIVQTTLRLDDTQSGESRYVYPIYAITPCPALDGSRFSPGITNVSAQEGLQDHGGKYAPLMFYRWDPWKCHASGVSYAGPYATREAADEANPCTYSVGPASYVQHEGKWYKLKVGATAHFAQGWHSGMDWGTGKPICPSHSQPDNPGLEQGCVSDLFASLKCSKTTCESMAWIRTSNGLLLNDGSYTEHVEWDCGGKPCWDTDPDIPPEKEMFEYDWHPFGPDIPLCGVTTEETDTYSIDGCNCKDSEGCSNKAHDMFCEHGPGWYLKKTWIWSYAEFNPTCTDSETIPPKTDPKGLYVLKVYSNEVVYIAGYTDLCCYFNCPNYKASAHWENAGWNPEGGCWNWENVWDPVPQDCATCEEVARYDDYAVEIKWIGTRDTYPTEEAAADSLTWPDSCECVWETGWTEYQCQPIHQMSQERQEEETCHGEVIPPFPGTGSNNIDPGLDNESPAEDDIQ